MFYKKFIACKLKIDYKTTLNVESFAASGQDISTKYKTCGIRTGRKSSYNSCWVSCFVCGHIVQTKASSLVCVLVSERLAFAIRFSHRTLEIEVCVGGGGNCR
jgi:hypothetical protein